ncbi:chromo (chromatin organization modifier) [Gracilaria domingensis]|nr:chromo (chromatin organization modifier) [Gracilaria domingensis]
MVSLFEGQSDNGPCSAAPQGRLRFPCTGSALIFPWELRLFIPPPRKATETTEEESVSCKLLPRTIGPLRVVKATHTTVTILDGDLHDTVSIDRITKSPRDPDAAKSPSTQPESPQPASASKGTPTPVSEASDPTGNAPSEPQSTGLKQVWVDPTTLPEPSGIPHLDVELPPELLGEEGDDSRKWVEEKVVDEGVAPDGSAVVKVRWCGYPPSKDSWEPLKNILFNFVARFRRRRDRARSRN